MGMRARWACLLFAAGALLVLPSAAVAAPPPNDDFAAAQAVAGESVSVLGSNVEATGEAGEPDHALSSQPLASVWYSWVAPAGGSKPVFGTNPIFVEAYDQIDVSLGYDFIDNFSLGLEVINLTGEDTRWHARSEKQIVRLEDQSARYSLGMRYKF